MATFLDVNEIKEKVSLLKLLNNLGFRAHKVSAGEHFFLSMLREEYTPSLCVNDKLGVWYDHGGAGVSGIRSGSIIDFALAYWYPSSFPEVLKKIVDYSQVQLGEAAEISVNIQSSKRENKLPHYAVDRVEESGNNLAIDSYLESRGLSEVAKGNLWEIYYHVIDDRNKKRNYFASGWPNENGGWEVRNKYFKGCLGHKGMSFLKGSTDRLCVFEGYFDFLSWRFGHPKDTASVLVLNSLSLLQVAKARVAGFRDVELYFDHDKAGIMATQEFLADVEISRDCSSSYFGFKDYNEKLIADRTSTKDVITNQQSTAINNGVELGR